jgi:hypothetical protein
VFEFAFGGGQPAADLAQGVGLAELAEQHGNELFQCIGETEAESSWRE